MPVTAWNVPIIKYRRLFSDKSLTSGASQIFSADIPWAADQMYWYYATPSETQDNYPQRVWIESVTTTVVSHAKLQVSVKVVNGAGVGSCKFHVWQAVAAKVLSF